ncbi:hypothetical protein Poli38472_003192 [Pythium oligandrum]|uniref:Uncharacterized protein n=1 Tax=Pythium oligandrum TaxID=41045 RepID=A0A8K1C754_PYTOL|nr:hypothetical protein Poli38472_003192 [Pythium oligandrum]|eukprot:TMW57267.1 hypothetical protein Poli38472_003192 [Pythium oligandrum]
MYDPLSRSFGVVLEAGPGAGKTTLLDNFVERFPQFDCVKISFNDPYTTAAELFRCHGVDAEQKRADIPTDVIRVMLVDDVAFKFHEKAFWNDLILMYIPPNLRFVFAGTYSVICREPQLLKKASWWHQLWRRDFSLSDDEARAVLQLPSGLPASLQTPMLMQVMIRDCKGHLNTLRMDCAIQKLRSKMAADEVVMESQDALISEDLQAVFDKLYSSKVAREDGQEEYEEVLTLLARLDVLQGDYVERQVMQNVMEKLMHVQSQEELRSALRGSDRANVDLQKRRAELELVVNDRNAHIARIAELVQQVEQEKQRAIEHEASRPAFDSEVEKLQAEWKELQKKNAQRKAAIQMATGMMITDEEDCGRILERQTMDIQDLHQRQKSLEERKFDLSTQVKQTAGKIKSLEKQNEIRSRDMHAKRREDQFATMGHMKDWYQNLNQLLTTITGIDIPRITSDYMELRVLNTHSMRLFFDADSTRLRHVEFVRHDVPADDLAAIAIRTNDIKFLASEYRDRVFQTQ